MDFRLTPKQEALKKEIYSFCEELAKKKPATFTGIEAKNEFDECQEYHRYCAREFGKKGWLTFGWPAEYGGKGDMMDKVIFSEAIGYFGLPGVDEFGVAMLAPTLLAAGSDAIKRKFLPGIAAGETMWCELWSEPNAGSDLAALTTTAIKKGDEYIVNGQKTWTTSAHRADWAFGVYRTDPQAPKHKNLTFMLCDMKSPGITVKGIPFMDGSHIYNEVYLDDVHIPANQVVGKEGEGWAVVNVLAGFERSNMSLVYGLLSAMEYLIAYCNEAKYDGVPLSRDPIVRNRVADLAIGLEAVRTLAMRIADQQSRNEMGLMDAAAVKVFASELMEKTAHVATDLFGPFGQVKFSRWAKLRGEFESMYMTCFVPIVSMGTNEIQRNIIAWYGLGLPRMK